MVRFKILPIICLRLITNAPGYVSSNLTLHSDLKIPYIFALVLFIIKKCNNNT